MHEAAHQGAHLATFCYSSAKCAKISPTLRLKLISLFSMRKLVALHCRVLLSIHMVRVYMRLCGCDVAPAAENFVVEAAVPSCEIPSKIVPCEFGCRVILSELSKPSVIAYNKYSVRLDLRIEYDTVLRSSLYFPFVVCWSTLISSVESASHHAHVHCGETKRAVKSISLRRNRSFVLRSTTVLHGGI